MNSCVHARSVDLDSTAQVLCYRDRGESHD
jgi:hypothetical protein